MSLNREPLGRKPESIPEQNAISFSHPDERRESLGITGKKFVRLRPTEYQILRLLHSHWGKQITNEALRKFATNKHGHVVSKGTFQTHLSNVELKLREATNDEIIIRPEGGQQAYRCMQLAKKSRIVERTQSLVETIRP